MTSTNSQKFLWVFENTSTLGYKAQWDFNLFVFTDLFRENNQLRLSGEDRNLLIENIIALPTWTCLSVKLWRQMFCLHFIPFMALLWFQWHPDTGEFLSDELGDKSSRWHLLFHICLALWMLLACTNEAVDNHPPSEQWDCERSWMKLI